MKAQCILACAVVGVAVSVFSGSPAAAESAFSGTIGFSADTVKPGDSVDIVGTCDDPAFTTAPVISSILDAPPLRGREDGTGAKSLISHATVKKDATPEIWQVSFTCGTEMVFGYLKVAETPKPEPYSAIGIQDREIHPGQEVAIIASCQDPAFRSSKVSSPVLTSPDLQREKGEPADSVLSAKGHINKDARAGTYSVSFVCAGKKVSGKFTVEAKPAPVQATPAQVPVKPKGAVEAGDLATAPTDNAPDTALVITGAGALLTAAGLGTLAYRRRRRA